MPDSTVEQRIEARQTLEAFVEALFEVAPAVDAKSRKRRQEHFNSTKELGGHA